MADQRSLFDDEPAAPDQPEVSHGAPLAHRMRPQSFDEVLGQDDIFGVGRPLRKAIDNGHIPSLVLWGPPGTGKTTLSRIIALATHAALEELSATGSGVADVRKVVARAEERHRLGVPTILFIDEIHRFNTAQQDVVLPHVESGRIHLIGATTENPSHSVNSALLSRLRVVALHALTPEQLRHCAERALADTERGLGSREHTLGEDALQLLATGSGGDARIMLTALELAAAATPPTTPIAADTIRDALSHPNLLSDRAGDQHYWLISAFIKSVRGSDATAALYWLARMLEGGEDPRFITRRLIILAAEDIGNADPTALQLAVSCHLAVQHIGMPEGNLPLTETTIALAQAPKSNLSVRAYAKAREDAIATREVPVPIHLRNAVTALDRSFSFGEEYRYPHADPTHGEGQQYLPDVLHGRSYLDSDPPS